MIKSVMRQSRRGLMIGDCRLKRKKHSTQRRQERKEELWSKAKGK